MHSSSHITTAYIGHFGVEDLAKMAGANYMGGKRSSSPAEHHWRLTYKTHSPRNTARTKSKDVVGRAQRRHFGKRRLASALCVTQENRVHTSAPMLSFLSEITLAHARRDASTDSGATSRKVISGDRLYSSRSPSNTTQRNKPSKILGALDTLDRVCSFLFVFCSLIQSRRRHVHASCH